MQINCSVYYRIIYCFGRKKSNPVNINKMVNCTKQCSYNLTCKKEVEESKNRKDQWKLKKNNLLVRSHGSPSHESYQSNVHKHAVFQHIVLYVRVQVGVHDSSKG